MQTKVLSVREMREKKVLLRAPVVMIPVLIFLFWVCGGGRGRAFAAARGFDMLVPAAHVWSITKTDKMGYYEKAKRDSAAAQQRARMEASYAKVLGIDSSHSPEAMAKEVQVRLAAVKKVLAGQGAGPSRAGGLALLPNGSTGPLSRLPDGTYDRLAGLSNGGSDRSRGLPDGSYDRLPRLPAPDLSRLERIASSLQHDDAGGAEISGLAAMIEKLAALQAPKRDSGARRVPVPQRAAFVVRGLPDVEDSLNGGDSSALEAIVPEEQVLESGGELKLELVRDVLVDGRRIPAGTPLYGIVSLGGERLRVMVSAIAWEGRVFPVQLQVDDEDGLAGIYIPGAPMMDASRESVSSEIGAVGPTIVSTGLAGQAANAGITLTRSLIGKKVRPVRVTVPSGYHVILHAKND